jgi:3-deoxy-D-manno-octulosonate 8-phosphate phosphatase (KDO 8-P phosphatase)
MTSVTLAERCRRIELLVLDVDGVLTDGRLYFLNEPAVPVGANGLGRLDAGAGVEAKAFFVRDGSAIKRWLAAGKRLALLSGRPSLVTWRRAQELGITAVVQEWGNKILGLTRLLAQFRVPALRTAMVGDDLADVPVLAACGLAVAVADARPEVRRLAHYVTQLPGGQGAVREVIDLILNAQGK